MLRTDGHAVRLYTAVAAALLLAAALTAYDYHPAHADGAFVVNTTADSNSKDAFLSLREAILVANGTLNSGLSAGEKAQLGGCTFSGSADTWAITGGCGAGILDTITFAFITGTIIINSVMPSLNDTAPTYIQGPNNSLAEVALDGSGIPPGANVLNIVSSGNYVQYLTIRHAPANGIAISGDNNHIWYGRVYTNGKAGIVLDNSANSEVLGTQLGFRNLDNPFTCSSATRNGGPNILLTNGTTTAAIDTVSSVCSPTDGVLITGTNTLSNFVRFGYHGTWFDGGGLFFLGNSGSGIAVRGGSDANRIEYNIVGNNQDGIVIAGPGTGRNRIEGNYVGRFLLATIANSQYGILLDGVTSRTDLISNTVGHNAQSGIAINGSGNNTALLQGNMVFGNGAHGILLLGSTSSNDLLDNDIYENAGHGILLTGTAAANLITGGAIHANGGAGIAQGGNASLNEWHHLSTYANGGLGIDKRADGQPTGPFPVIGPTIQAGVGVTVTGIASASLTVELYRVARDPSGYGEGKTYVGQGVADADGNWQIADPAGPGCYTAQMHGLIVIAPFATEFGRDNACLFLPVTIR